MSTSTEKITLSVLIGEREYTVSMFDNPTTKDLLAQLPLTLAFRDYADQEKKADAPTPLTMAGAPQSGHGQVGDFIYYAPNNALVFCYTDIGSWSGIVRLGTFIESIEDIRSFPDGFRVTIERADT